MNIALGSNLEYEVGKRYNFWFRVGLFKPTSGSSSMDLIDERFAFQFYVMGKLGIKAGVRLKAYAAIGSVDAVSVGLTAELGPYVKLWGFFIYDYQKYRPQKSQNWASREQMTGALYMEFGLYLMVGMEAKALFLEYDKDFVDEEFPLLDAGDRRYCYDAAYRPLDENDEIVVYNDGSADLRSGCAVSMALPEETYALKYMDLVTGKQGIKPMTPDNYTFKVSNPNFRVDIVNGKPVVSVISIPQDVRLMQCDLTITYRHGKLVFSDIDISTTVHLVWTSLTASEYQQFYTASVVVPDGSGGMEAVWSKRVRKGQPFELPTEVEVRTLLNWSDAKYTEGTGYNGQQTEGVTIAQNTQYVYDLDHKTCSLTVTGIERSGYGFDGWYTDPDFAEGTKVSANTRVNGPMTLYAKWAAGAATVTFNTNGGLNLTKNTKAVIYDSPYGDLPTPERSGYGFRGWFTEKEGGEAVTADTLVSKNENHTLYARWEPLMDLTKSGPLFEVMTRTITYSRNYTYTLDDLSGLYKQKDGLLNENGEPLPTDGFRFALKPKSAGGLSNGKAHDAGTYILEITRNADDQYYAFTETHNILIIEKADWVEAIWNPMVFTAVIYGKDNTLTNTVTVKTPTGDADLSGSIVGGMKWKIHRHKKGTFKEKTQTSKFGATFGDNGSGAECEIYLVFPSGATSNNYILPSQVLMYKGGIRTLLHGNYYMTKKGDEPVPVPRDSVVELHGDAVEIADDAMEWDDDTMEPGDNDAEPEDALWASGGTAGK